MVERAAPEVVVHLLHGGSQENGDLRIICNVEA